MTDNAQWYKARDELNSSVIEDLMGPTDASALTEPPLNRIIVGVLYPQAADSAEADFYHAGLTEDENEQAPTRTSSDESPTDPPVSLSQARAPSSMGLTFTVDVDSSPTVEVVVKARRFVEQDSSWMPIDVSSTVSLTTSQHATFRGTTLVSTDLRLRYVIRATEGRMSRITVALVNEAMRPTAGRMDESCWFRPVISCTASEFIDRKREEQYPSADFDRRSSSFLYRNQATIAVGHGCAVTWDDVQKVQELSTTFFPSHDVQLADPNGGNEGDPFGEYTIFMDALVELDFDRSPLTAMVDAYDAWIAEQTSRAAAMSEADREIAQHHIALAVECATRIRSGISALETGQVERAFCLMNQAMLAQRDAQDRARGTDPRRQQWRAFQMAFILINLPALADSAHSDRDIADLLWFPTGGGKTEAYLGCIAFTIMLRRLRKTSGEISDDSGVAAIMRYTLRLLTRQQFERAAGLICGLELIRRRSLPGTTKISLGLWVGQTASPNKLDDARIALDKLRAGQPTGGQANPVQLVACPWCGTPLTSKHYSVENSLVIACGESTCDFGDGLPLYLVDDDIYQQRPTLLIGTVDKFAQMTWRSEVSRLLPVGTETLPPELIIQDELHLISGPLGTMVGLYESALDMACSSPGRPKVLASTATIRRASQQVRAVFNRESKQFPPPGLDPDDNYFARPAAPHEKGTRRYVGVMAPGTSQTSLLVRLYAAILHNAAESEADDDVKDAYWTLLGYFNSLRVLSSMYLQVLDDIPKRIEVIARREGQQCRQISQEPVELTSRIDQTQIPVAMSAIERSYPHPSSPDVVLATNMISVGLDIDRLGLMVVAGQPQSTSEYIQATSRVGRRHPGLVFVALNAHRSRDRSHFESFIPFHRSLYREVEATTVTPFASRARDRGAHGVLIAAARLLISELRADSAAADVVNHIDRLEPVISRLIDRCRTASDEENLSDAMAFERQLRDLLDQWVNSARQGTIDSYGKMIPAHLRAKRDSIDRPLLVTADSGRLSAGSYPVSTPPWPTLTSMRDVDADTSLYVTRLNPPRSTHNGE